MSEENELPELPKGWCYTFLSPLLSVTRKGMITGPFGSLLKKYEHQHDGIPVLGIENISRMHFIVGSKIHISEEKAKQLSLYDAQSGDILISRSGTVGEVCVVPDYLGEARISTNLMRVALKPDGLLPQFFCLLFNGSSFVLEQVSELCNGSTRDFLSQAILSAILFPLPPLSEQQRIVTAIELQFTRLDAAVTALQHTKAKLKRYRASVLKAAVEGKLTEAWRAEHPATEPASVLLERILVERRAKWEADLRAKGKDPAKVKYVEPAVPNVEGLPGLPEGWCWTTVEQVGDVGTGATPLRGRPDYYDHGTIPWITSGALNEEVVTSAEQLITEKALKETNAKVFPIGTLLLAMYGEGKTRGKVSELQIEAATNQACAAIVLNSVSIGCHPYIKYFLLSNYFEIRRLSVGGVQPNLNLTIVKETCIPFPPLLEQEQIVPEVERRLSIVTQLEATVEANLKRAERLRQSTLKEAFAGRLVPRDPNGEPASVLLERIYQEREGQKQGPIKKARAIKTISAPRMPDVEPIEIDASEMEQMDLWASIGSRE